jgi:D-alanyl-D-alanine carboxypeptidase
MPQYIEPMTEEPVWYNGYVDPRTVRAEVVTNPEDITVLINKYFAMPEDYVPEIVLANNSAGQYINVEAAESWDLMHAACLEECGENLYLISGYRTYAEQTYSFSHAIERRGLTKAVEKNAYQGRSEHPLGLAFDINIASDPEIRDAFAESKAGIWVNEHGHEYGFFLRYPRDKGDITGYGYEAWHYRYVGVDLATILYETGQTLEEYYGKEQILPESSPD